MWASVSAWLWVAGLCGGGGGGGASWWWWWCVVVVVGWVVVVVGWVVRLKEPNVGSGLVTRPVT